MQSTLNSHQLQPDKWVQLYADALFSYTIARVQDSTAAEDIVQDTFLSAWKAREQYNGTASEKTWLYAICKNKIIDYFRRKATDKLVLNSTDEDSCFDAKGNWKPDEAPKRWQVPETSSIETKEFYKILASCKNKLKQIQQMVFSMKYHEEVDTDEICKLLNITSSNYWVLIHRAKLHLRKCLEKNWMGLP